MGRKLLVAAFYSPAEFDLDALGVTADTWGPFSNVNAHVTRLDDHTCATVWFSQYDFFGLRDGHEPTPGLARDPALPFACFFRDTAVKAGCEVAFLATRLHQADPDWLEGQYWAVQAREADSLVAEAFGLLYLDNGMVLDWDAPRLDQRNVLPGGPGLTIFGGAGWSRWF
jgi:hypothetical protein